MIDVIVFGILGMALILLAFVLDEIGGRISRDSVEYNALNVFGALLLLYYAYSIGSIPFLVLNSVWFLVAAIKLGKLSKNIIHKGA
ncbi:MAG: hypothetical protein KAI53_02985 [Candidatus Aenigmarchaeota archaeon]|nr:hypothetical protein [Candidatus Aenigmarchaeota archaeon]